MSYLKYSGLRLKLTYLSYSYAPGDILIFHSSALYHMVTPWRPSEGKGKDGITPGRIARVYTTHLRILCAAEKQDWRAEVHTLEDMRKMGVWGKVQ